MFNFPNLLEKGRCDNKIPSQCVNTCRRLSLGAFFKKVATRNSCLSQAFRVSGSAGVWAVMTGLTGRKTECGSTVPSVSALYDAVCE